VIVVAICFAMIIYSFAIKKTILLYKEYGALSRQLKLEEDAPLKTIMLERKLGEMDKSLGNKQNENNNNVQQTLLGSITTYCQNNNVTLREFPKTIHSRERDILMETNVFVLEGGFSRLLHFVYLLEQRNKIGRIASVHFQSKRDTKTKSLFLTAAIYVQSIKKIKNEN
jgi:hypothetical protein